MGHFACLLLTMGVYRQSVQLQHNESFGLGGDNPPNTFTEASFSPAYAAGSTLSGSRGATNRLYRLYHQQAVANLHGNSSPALGSALTDHYHITNVLLRVPSRDLFGYCGYRVNKSDMTDCSRRLRSWVKQRGPEAREAVFHASCLFSRIRDSGMLGYYEGRSLMIACIVLWVYSDATGRQGREKEEEDMGSDTVITRRCQDRDQRFTEKEQVTVRPCRLDLIPDGVVDDIWIRGGAGLDPYLPGVGNIMGSDGVSRLIRETSRLLRTNACWPMYEVSGRALVIFHALRSGAES